jgi:transmembrane sensor
MSIRSDNAKANILNEASEWFVEFRAGAVSGNTRARFDEWLRRSPEHIQAYLDVAAGWSELPTADPLGRIDIAALVARARATPDENVVPLSMRSARPSSKRRLLTWGLAASLLMLAGTLGVLEWRANMFSTGVGEQRTVWLADGSTAELNALSKIRVRLSGTRREIELAEGQVLFHVAKDGSRPFIVRSGATTIRAVGTEFDVYRKSTGTVVTVLEGRVAVADEHTTQISASGASPGVPPVLLSAGEQVIVTAQQIQRPKSADVSVSTAWVQKRLVFEETPLAEVAEQFNRYSTRRLIIVDPELRTLGISGVYSAADPDSLLGFLRMQPSLEVNESDAEIRVTRREKK